MNYSRSSRSNNKTGFTLIELLVVISIIALLIGILLPALSAARESAKSMQCLSNLRSINVGVHAYANEYNDRIVHARLVTPGNPNPLYWVEALWDSLEFGQQPAPPQSIWDLAPWDGTVLYCPSTTLKEPDSATRSYGCNVRIQPGYGGVDGDKGTYSKLSSVINPTKAAIFADDQNTILEWRSDMGKLLKDSIYFQEERHAGGTSINVAYLDGHASAEGAENLPIDVTTFDHVFWNGDYR